MSHCPGSIMYTRSLIPLALCAGTVLAQNGTVPASTSMSLSQTSSSVSPTMSMGISVEDLWNLMVGPVQTALINTTVSPTPVPSSELIPPPPLYYSPFPTGQQQPMYAPNASWSFPSDFWWGVAGAAYQIEGAVKDEGRGSIQLLHSSRCQLTVCIRSEYLGCSDAPCDR